MLGATEAVRVSASVRTTDGLLGWLTGPARRDWQALLVCLFGLDVLMLALAFIAAGMLRLALDRVSLINGFTPGQHFMVSLLVLPALLVMFRAHGLYDREHILVGTREFSQVAHAVTYGVFIALAASYFASDSHFVSRSWLLLVWALGICCVSLGRFVARRVVRQLRQYGLLRVRVVIVGASTFGLRIARQVRAATQEGADVLGFLDEYLPLGQPLLDDMPVIGRPDDLLRGDPALLADEFILIPQALPHQRQEEIYRLMASRANPVLRMAVSSGEMLTHGVRVVQRGNVPLVTVQRARLQGAESVWKRTFDIVGAALALILITPIVSVLLLRNVLLGRWPLVRRYAIIGAEGKPGVLWLLEPDVASWPPLRGAPALLSVLTGQLSLVGPRPKLCHSGPQTEELTAVTPGLTGPWRLSGPDASREVQAVEDLSYVRNYTIWEDLRIVWQSMERLRSGRLPSLLGRWDDHLPPSPSRVD